MVEVESSVARLWLLRSVLLLLLGLFSVNFCWWYLLQKNCSHRTVANVLGSLKKLVEEVVSYT